MAIKPRKRKQRHSKEKTDSQKAIKKFRKNSNRHVIVVEIVSALNVIYSIFHLSEMLRRAGNDLAAVMLKRYNQLIRTREYRWLKKLYAEAIKAESEIAREVIANKMQELQKEYNVTQDYCTEAMITIRKRYKLPSTFASTRADDIWHGVERCLYGNGETIHFKKHGDYPSIRAEQINRGLPLHRLKDGKMIIKYDGNTLFVKEPKKNDYFLKEELEEISGYLDWSEIIDWIAAENHANDKSKYDTFRPCYVTLVPQIIRGKYRVFAHITVEGMALPKRDKSGKKPRHTYGSGTVGCDIGTQTIAYTSETEVGLKNLSERGMSIKNRERKERILYRAMDRSRRANNPQNYNPDGTIKKGKKTWHNSNHYLELRREHSEMSRICAINRKLACNEDVNHLRSLGDVFITEPKNADKLARRAKKTTKNKKGKFNRKKRFGKSIQNRCPGYFQQQAKSKFESTGGAYFEVPYNYRASQYDHTNDTYVKKKLSQRMFDLSDGTTVQRDWYSSYLLYCYNYTQSCIDIDKCKNQFKEALGKEIEVIAKIIKNRIHVFNSGIKIS